MNTKSNKNQYNIPGGTTGQALVKNSNTDFDFDWGAGGGGGIDSTAGTGNPPATSSTQTITHGLGRIPKIIRITGVGDSFYSGSSSAPQYDSTISNGIWNSSGNSCISTNNSPSSTNVTTSSVFAISIRVTNGAGSNNINTGIIQNVTLTTFDIAWTNMATGVNAAYMWEAE